MVVYYIKKEGERLADYRYPIKEGDICMLYDGEVIKTVYIDSELDSNSIWRDFKFIDTKSLKSYQFPTSNSILCAPVGDKHAIGDTGLLTQLIKECKGEWLLDFLNDTSAVLSGFVDYWDLGILSRFIGDNNLDVVYENEESLTEFLENPEENEEVDDYDEEEDFDDVDLSPKCYDVKWFCLSALSCIEGQMDKRNYQILYDTLNGDKRSEIADRNHLTQERIRQIVVKATKQAREILIDQRKNIEETKAENAQLNAQLNLLREDIVRLKALVPIDAITSIGNESEELSKELTLLLDTPIENINLTVRATNILIYMGVKKFSDIPQIESSMKLLKERNSGRKTVYDVSQMLEAFYLTFGMSYTEIVNVLKVKDWHTAKKKWINNSENEEIIVKLKDDNPTEKIIKEKDFIKNSTINIPNHTQGNPYYQPDVLNNPIDREQEGTMFSDDSKWLNKRRFVLETVRMFVRMHPHISYESLIRIFPASLNYNKANGVILRYDDVVKKIKFNPRARNYFFLEEDEIIDLYNGTKIVVHSQWGTDFDNFLKVAENYFNVAITDNLYKLNASKEEGNGNVSQSGKPRLKEDKRIGYTVRLFPSQQVGVIVGTKVDSKGIKKLVVRTNKGSISVINDLPYLYEVLKSGTVSNNEAIQTEQERSDKINKEKDTIVHTRKEFSMNSFDENLKSNIDVTYSTQDERRMKAVLKAMENFMSPVTPRVIACTIDSTTWGDEVVNENTVDSILKLLPEVEYVKWGKYILKRRNK